MRSRFGRGGIRAGWPAGLAVVSLALLAVLGIACEQGGSGEGRTPEGIIVTVTTPSPRQATPSATRTPTPTASPTATPLRVCSENPDPAPPSLLQVQEPQPEQRVRVPFHVRGWGSNIGFQESGVVVALVNADQKVVQDWVVPPQPRTYRILPPGLANTDFTRPFGIDIALSGLGGPTPFCLWVFQETDTEGRAKGVVQVPILVVP